LRKETSVGIFHDSAGRTSTRYGYSLDEVVVAVLIVSQNLKLVDALKSIADKKGITPGQLALAWVLAQGDDFFTIPGTKSKK
jgi:aryl-alcohol dehydrogenase-like predicted oxidoreductase